MKQIDIVNENYRLIEDTLNEIYHLDNIIDDRIIRNAVTNCALSIFTVFEDYIGKLFDTYIELSYSFERKILDYDNEEIYSMKLSNNWYAPEKLQTVFEDIRNNAIIEQAELKNYFRFSHFNERNFNKIDKKFQRIFKRENSSYLGSLEIEELSNDSSAVPILEKNTLLAKSIIIQFSTKYRHRIAHDVHNNLLSREHIPEIQKQLSYFAEIINLIEKDFNDTYRTYVKHNISEI